MIIKIDRPRYRRKWSLTMSNSTEERVRWTTADLDLFPDDGTRYEIVDGELFMAKAPHWRHQRTCGKMTSSARRCCPASPAW
jgi:hypothetical protein